ncbi:MAG: hypothetical protein RL585_1412, partial [Pseudomonadota bacterium]
MASDIEKAPEALQRLVAEADTGGRKPSVTVKRFVMLICLLWAMFQFWYASPLPFALGFGVLNDTEARSIHLGFALFLGFLLWPFSSRSQSDRVPWFDWLFAVLACFAGAYLLIFYSELATRPGQPTRFDVFAASLGLLLLLEATRRAVGLPMALLALLFIAYAMAGPWMPEVLQHKGA